MADDPFLGFCTATVRFERLLGRGAMGAVYQGVQLSLQRQVAIKVIAPHLLEDPAYLARFEREAHTVGRLVHPNIISCHDFGPCEGPSGERHYLMVMEFVDGWSLGHLAKTRKLQVRQVLDLHRQAAEGLQAAHAIGIIHRDIKPDNIMVTREGVAKLADFGLARSLSNESDITMAGSILGSPAYMSPEACQGEEPTAKSDIYSLGCSLIQVLSGVVAFPAQSGLAMMQMHITDPVPRLADRRGDLEMLQPLIDACMAKPPAERADARQLARQIGEYTPTISRSVIAGRLEIKPGGNNRVGAGSRAASGETGGGSSAVAQTIATRKPLTPDAAWWRWPSTPLARRRVAIGISLLVPCAGLLMLVVSLTHRPAGSAASPPADASHSDPATAIQAHLAAQTQPLPVTPELPVPDAPVTPATPPPAPTDAADLDALAQAEALVHQGHLDEAQDLLDRLVVAGELKVRKNAVVAGLQEAWTKQQATLVGALDVAEAELSSQPRQAIDELTAMDISDHFPDLEHRRDALMTRARAQAAITGSEPAPQAPVTAGGNPAPAAVPGAGAAGDHTHGLPIQLFVGQRVDANDPALPDSVPGGAVIFFRSLLNARVRSQQVMALHLPPGGDSGHGGVLLLVHGGVKRTLEVAVFRRGQAPGAIRSSDQLSGSGWELVRVAVDDSREQQTLVLSSDAAAGNFYLATALWNPNAMPQFPDLHVVPGMLRQAPGGLESALARLKATRPDFPDFSKMRVSMPQPVVNHQGDGGKIIVNMIRQSVGLEPLTGPGLDQSVKDLLTGYAPGPLFAEMVGESLRGAQGVGGLQFLNHYQSTNFDPAPSDVDACIAALHEALYGPHPILPVLIFGPECWYKKDYPAWQALIQKLQQQVPEIPMIEMSQVPLFHAASGEVLDPNAMEAKLEFTRGFSNALVELHGRIMYLMGHH